MNPAAAKRLRLLASVVSVLLVLAVAIAAWFYFRLRASLPQLDGHVAVAGLTAPAVIERDAQGVPTIRAASRIDAASALGWLHAQDRYFQMDAMRRTAAGELSELVGKRAVGVDRGHRIHGFRRLARTAVANLPPEHRALLEAYAAGANAGLAALRSPPFEYTFLRTDPEPWQPEDTMLVAYAMTLDLQDETGLYEKTLMTLRDEFGATGVDFFAPLLTPDDAALDGSTQPVAPIPGPQVIDLRPRKGTARMSNHPPGPAEIGVTGAGPRPFEPFLAPARRGEFVLGSNAFALAGNHTANGAALVANDMHLNHRVPNTWYRTVIEFPDATASAATRRLVGVTLPGVPLLIAGSNGDVAWAFTASYADTVDLIVIEQPGGLTTYYLGADGESHRIETRQEVIRVKGDKPVTVDYQWTIWGPIIGQNERGRPLALRWVAHDPKAMDLGLLALETARDTDDAVTFARRAGMPAQNIVIGDRHGATAWTIAGVLPKRFGYDGRLPTTWAYGDRRWEGFLKPDEIPAVRDVPLIWSANQRHLGGDALERIGDGGYPRPHRGAQIRDGLAQIARATPRDLLGVQLDDRALFLEPWHKLLLETLTPEVMAQKGPRAALRPFAEHWTGRASIDSVGYPIAKQFRAEVYARVFGPIFASCRQTNPEFDPSLLNLEPAIWTLLREKPAHLLNPEFTRWEDLLVAAVDDVIGFLDKQAITMPNATWGRRNTVHIRHPFSFSLPDWLTQWIDLPAAQLPGDNDMPRVQTVDSGASERLVVSPGREAEGIFHMPGGQSAHPLSPFFRAGHEAWAQGAPTPLMPSKTQHTLTLNPQNAAAPRATP